MRSQQAAVRQVWRVEQRGRECKTDAEVKVHALLLCQRIITQDTDNYTTHIALILKLTLTLTPILTWVQLKSNNVIDRIISINVLHDIYDGCGRMAFRTPCVKRRILQRVARPSTTKSGITEAYWCKQSSCSKCAAYTSSPIFNCNFITVLQLVRTSVVQKHHVLLLSATTQ